MKIQTSVGEIQGNTGDELVLEYLRLANEQIKELNKTCNIELPLIETT